MEECEFAFPRELGNLLAMFLKAFPQFDELQTAAVLQLAQACVLTGTRMRPEEAVKMKEQGLKNHESIMRYLEELRCRSSKSPE